MFYLLSTCCSTGNHVSQFNARYIFITTYACFLINSHNQLLLHSFIMRHPWSCSKFYQVWLLSPPFRAGLGNAHYLAYSMELSGSVCFQLEHWKDNSEVSFICVWAYALQTSFFNALLQTYSWLFYQSRNLRRLVSKCCLFPQSLEEHAELGWLVHTKSWLCFCHSTSVLLCFTLPAWF